MSKRLSIVGNSLALIIERPMLRALRFTRDTELDIITDGQRLIIERSRNPTANAAVALTATPTPTATPRPPSSLDLRRRRAQQTYGYLEYRLLGPLHLEAIGAGKMRNPRSYLTHVSERETADPVLVMVMDRMEVLREQREENKSWDDAIAVAIERVPTVDGAGSLGVFTTDDDRRRFGEPVGE